MLNTLELRELLRTCGNIKGLSKKARVSRASIYNIISGKHSPSLEIAERLVAAAEGLKRG